MKYWKELNELEEAVYNIKSIQAGLNILCQTEEFTCYSPSGITQEHQTFVLDLNERFNTAVEKLNERFQEVWNAVRDDAPWDHYSDLPSPKAYEEDGDTTPPWEEDLEAIDELVKEHEAKERFDKILSNLPTMDNVQYGMKLNPIPTDFTKVPSSETNNWSIEPLENGDFTVNFDHKGAYGTWTIKEEDGNLTTDYRPHTQQDLFDDQWNEAYRRQSQR